MLSEAKGQNTKLLFGPEPGPLRSYTWVAAASAQKGLQMEP